MIDFLIVYEHRARELENACLLAAELEYRGYSVKIKNVLSLHRYFINSRVVIAPHLYNDWQVTAIAKNFQMNHKRILDLQYEQVLSAKVNENGLHNPKESAALAEHIAWGENQVNKYLKNGIERNNIHNVGCISMDLNTTAFNKYFKTRVEIANEYNLDITKEWVLFISSFAYTKKSKEEIEAYKHLNPDVEKFMEISNKSRKPILEWIEKALSEDENKIFIYRKHPSESEDSSLINLSEENQNFRYIDDYSIRQWIRVADKFYTWFSTSIVDAYFSKKSCYILRPFDIPQDFDSEIMVGAHFISNYKDFYETLHTNKISFPIASDVIERYYNNKENKLVFIDIANLCIKMLNDDSYDKNYDYGSSRLYILNSKSAIKNIKQIITSYIFDVSQFIRLSKIMSRALPESRIKTLKKFEKETYKVHKEINEYKIRFKRILGEIHEYSDNYSSSYDI